jgi:transcriptional regulator with XRE-family HTH domain
MRRTSLTQNQAATIARLLRNQREMLGMSMREVARAAQLNVATISEIESGINLSPLPETLKAIARALDLPVSDLYAAADWLPHGELPTFAPYLRAKYSDMPESAVSELATDFDRLAEKYGVSANGPTDGQDEH